MVTRERGCVPLVGWSVVGHPHPSPTITVGVGVTGVPVVRGVPLVLEPPLVPVVGVPQVMLGVARVLAGVPLLYPWLCVSVWVASILPVGGVPRVPASFPGKIIVGKFRIVSAEIRIIGL